MARTRFENLQVYQLSEKLCDQIWDIVKSWPRLAQDTMGKQVIRSSDGIGATIAEGDGRGTFVENRRYLRIARGSLQETQHWLRRAYRRKLLTDEQVNVLRPLVDELAPKLNAYIRSMNKLIKKPPSPQDPDKDPRAKS